MATRDLKLEQAAVDSFIKYQNKTPSTPDDWKAVHTFAYGTDLPPELASLDMYKSTSSTPASTTISSATTTSGASTNPLSNVSGDALTYRGQDISDSAISAANTKAQGYDQGRFLETVKAGLRQKFKPETEVLGLGAFASTLGALDPNGVMSGINEKTGQFKRKGTLMLQALATGGDIYAADAKKAADNLTRLDTLRNQYETEQKAIESDMKQLALTIAQTGQNIPEEILALLPTSQRAAYEGLPAIYAAGLGTEPYGGDNTSNGWSGDEIVLEQGKGDAYECGYWARGLGDYAGGVGMGNTFKSKVDWVNKFGTRGTEGLGVGDLVITDGSDVSKNGSPLGTGHALIVGAIDAKGNIYAYESNAKGDKTVTFGRWVDPSAIYGSVKGNMKDGEFERMQSLAMKYDPSKRGAPTTTAKENKQFDTLISANLSPAEEAARLKMYVGEDKTGSRLAAITKQYDAYKQQKIAGNALASTDINNAIKDAFVGLEFATVADKEKRYSEILELAKTGQIDRVKEQLLKFAQNSVTGTERQQVVGRKEIIESLNDIEKKMDEYVAQGGDLGVFTGLSEKALNKVGTTVSPELAELASSIGLALIDYRRSKTGAAFTESESAAYNKVMPNEGKTLALNKALIKSAKDQATRNQEVFYKTYLGENSYNTIFKSSDKIKTPTSYTSYTEFVSANPTLKSMADAAQDYLASKGWDYDWQDIAEYMENNISK